MPTFTPLGGGLPGSDLGMGENSLFGSNDMAGGSNTVAAPQFAELGASSSGPGVGILGGPLQQMGQTADEMQDGAN